MEKEVALSLSPADFAKKASITISAEESRGILDQLGIKIPSNISLSNQSTIIKNTPKLSASQIEAFYKKASELNKQK